MQFSAKYQHIPITVCFSRAHNDSKACVGGRLAFLFPVVETAMVRRDSVLDRVALILVEVQDSFMHKVNREL